MITLISFIYIIHYFLTRQYKKYICKNQFILIFRHLEQSEWSGDDPISQSQFWDTKWLNMYFEIYKLIYVASALWQNCFGWEDTRSKKEKKGKKKKAYDGTIYFLFSGNMWQFLRLNLNNHIVCSDSDSMQYAVNNIVKVWFINPGTNSGSKVSCLPLHFCLSFKYRYETHLTIQLMNHDSGYCYCDR